MTNMYELGENIARHFSYSDKCSPDSEDFGLNHQEGYSATEYSISYNRPAYALHHEKYQMQNYVDYQYASSESSATNAYNSETSHRKNYVANQHSSSGYRPGDEGYPKENNVAFQYSSSCYRPVEEGNLKEYDVVNQYSSSDSSPTNTQNSRRNQLEESFASQYFSTDSSPKNSWNSEMNQAGENVASHYSNTNGAHSNALYSRMNHQDEYIDVQHSSSDDRPVDEWNSEIYHPESRVNRQYFLYDACFPNAGTSQIDNQISNTYTVPGNFQPSVDTGNQQRVPITADNIRNIYNCSFCGAMGGVNCAHCFEPSRIHHYSRPLKEHRDSVHQNVGSSGYSRHQRTDLVCKEQSKKRKACLTEKKRVKSVNSALELLKTYVPFEMQRHEKMSKLKILRFAINYIKGLSHLLEKMDRIEEQRINNRPSCSYAAQNDFRIG